MYDIKCIISIVERGEADKVVEAAKEEGASGATIFYARGTGESEVKKFLNINVESAKEVIIILSDKSEVESIMKAMAKAGELEEAGKGIIFSLPVANLIGLNHREEFID